MKRYFTLIILFIGSGIQLFSQDTRINVLAQNSRYPGAANFLNRDFYLVQTYPSSVFEYGTHFSVNAPNIGNTVTGNYGYASLMYAKKKMAIGAYMGRSTVIPPYGAISPIDLLLGYKITDNLSVGAIISRESITIKDTTTKNPAKSVITAIGFQPSVSLKFKENMGVDASVPVVMGNGQSQIGDTNILAKANYSAYGVLARFYSNAFVIPFSYGIVTFKTELPVTKNITTNTTTNLHTGIGRMHFLSEDKKDFFLYGLNVLYQNTVNKTEVNGVAKPDTKTGATILGLLFGGEFKMYKDKLVGRAAISYDFYNQSRQRTVTSDFGFPGNMSFGLGYDLKYFRVDGALSTNLLTNGFFFLTGNVSAFMPSITIVGKL